MPIPADPTPETGFEPHLFWEEHKQKILLYGALFLAALFIFGIYQYTSERKLSEAQNLFAQAKSPDDYRKIIQQFPRSVSAANAQMLLADQLRSDKKYDEAVATLRALIDQSPEYPLLSGAWLSLAATLEQQGKNDEALDMYQQVASKFTDSYAAPLALMAQANLLKTKGKIDEAKQAFERVLSQFPDSLCARQAMRDSQLLRK